MFVSIIELGNLKRKNKNTQITDKRILDKKKEKRNSIKIVDKP